MPGGLFFIYKHERKMRMPAKLAVKDEVYLFYPPRIDPFETEFVFYKNGHEDILFTARDSEHRKWLCSCCRLGEHWIIVRVSNKDLLDLMDNKLSIRDVFEKHPDRRLFVVFDTYGGIYYKISHGIPESALPVPGAMLDLPEWKIGDYRATVQRRVETQRRIRENIRSNHAHREKAG